jgi:hypothetical protein
MRSFFAHGWDTSTARSPNSRSPTKPSRVILSGALWGPMNSFIVHGVGGAKDLRLLLQLPFAHSPQTFAANLNCCHARKRAKNNRRSFTPLKSASLRMTPRVDEHSHIVPARTPKNFC